MRLSEFATKVRDAMQTASESRKSKKQGTCNVAW